LAFSVSEHLGLALANLSLQEKLRSQALSDPLTGLFNRRFFEQKLEEHAMNSATTEQPLSLLMLDLDHFKRFNDNFGHDAGDFVLKEISALLKHSVGDDEIASRVINFEQYSHNKSPNADVIDLEDKLSNNQ
jgi:GGDEF domain-containing protein